MKMEDCDNDPKFRVALVEGQIESLNDLINNNTNAIRYNQSSIVILKEIEQNIELDEESLTILNENLNEINTFNKDLDIQRNRFKIMIDIYEKYLKFKNNVIPK